MNLHPDEPVFILRAQDMNAPDEVYAWARRYIQHSGTTEAQFKKALSAIQLAEEMKLWQKLNPDKVKLPD